MIKKKDESILNVEEIKAELKALKEKKKIIDQKNKQLKKVKKKETKKSKVEKIKKKKTKKKQITHFI